MRAADSEEPMLNMLRQSTVGMVRRRDPDLSAPQLAAFLICCLDNAEQTVSGLAAKLNVGRPAVSKARDRLTEFNLVRRKQDPFDRRSTLVQRTQARTACCGCSAGS